MPCKVTRMWFLIVRKTYPWATLIIIALRVIASSGSKRNREKARFLMTSVKIDYAGILSLLNDLLW